MKLKDMGFDGFFEAQVQTEDQIGRIIKYAQNHFTMMTPEGAKPAVLKGSLHFEHVAPRIGDFVVYETTEDGSLHVITRLLDRKTCLARKEAGTRFDEQVIAANMDYLFIVMSLNEDFNLRRLERYMVGAWESGAEPIVILTKRDLCNHLTEHIEEVQAISYGVKTFAISALTGEGMEQLLPFHQKATTIALVGSSGVGKSTLINYLAGEEVMKTDGLRNDDKGHHTTTHREMIFTDGAMLVDTPGMREFGITETHAGIQHGFEDIEGLAASCKFGDCTHNKEPGCAIQQAISNGDLSAKRYQNYLLLQKEAARMQKKLRQKAMFATKRAAKEQRKSKPRKKNWNTACE